ncbi:MAG: hypothetical protein ABI824_10975 [Acidobacteriota bacterium]
MKPIALALLSALVPAGLMLSGLFSPRHAAAQTQAQAPVSVPAAWDAAPKIAELSAQAARLKPLLEQLTPEDWVAKGAPATYVTQWRDAKLELDYLATAASILQKQPEKLTAALDTYFRLQSLEVRLDSLIEGVRKYHNPAVGDLITGVLRANSANRDGLRQYITDLATQKEQEMGVIDAEAQRCSADLNRLRSSSKAAPARTKSGK